MLAEAIGRKIAEATGRPFRPVATRPAGGGSINDAEILRGVDGSAFFVKLNAAERLPMFEAEADGLREIAATGALRCPLPICCGAESSRAFLVLEFLDLNRRGGSAELGRRLAEMHRVQRPRYGWWRDNTIGATAQINTECESWLEFWRDRRLAPQLALAARNGAAARLLRDGERLMASLGGFFGSDLPAASLLHGDLWGGNFGFAGGEPVIFDPAVYFGDRETDLAMTELFGGFPADFYAAYREAWPLDQGYEARKLLYNLYHVLNHFNLFGGGYGAQAERMAGRLLAECG